MIRAIAPWNAPISLAMEDRAGLGGGKHDGVETQPVHPACTLKIESCSRTCSRPACSTISGGDGLGPMMTAHPGFAKISFTGSTATGKRVMESAAKDLKRLTLELGGNDAAIVLPDVDLDVVAEKTFFGFYNSAQICVATKRLYVHEDIYDELRASPRRLGCRGDRRRRFAAGRDLGPDPEQAAI